MTTVSVGAGLFGSSGGDALIDEGEGRRAVFPSRFWVYRNNVLCWRRLEVHLWCDHPF
ncbi:MAG: hypothetical protein PUP93_14075 [Rhizonema sp. NSF051]|nr:hypothetical protein [Rhizonema sp. NSF051]